MRSGRGSDDIYLSNLWYFDLLMFIKDQEQPTSSISNIIRSPSSVLTEDISNDHNDSEDNINSDAEREKDTESPGP